MYDYKIELINIVPFNPLISKCQIKVCWVGDTPNRNKSIITKDTAKEMANSLPGSPIVGYYNETAEDFEAHNKIIEVSGGKFRLKPTTRPYGFVDLGAKVWFQWFVDPDGIEREYLVTEGWLWTGQFPECQRVIDKGNNHSMELDEDPNYLDAYWTKDINGNNEFFIINEAIISKLCILGEDYEPCFEGGNITAPKIEFSFEDDFKEQLFSLMKEIRNILNEGGASVVNNENTPVVETPEVEEPVVETPVIEEPVVAEEPTTEFAEDKKEEEEKCEKCGKPLSECDCEDKKEDEEKGKGVKYSLEEIPEYIELRDKYSNLENSYNELEVAHNSLKTEVEALTQFKAQVEKKEKEDMIKSFYMLSDEDKKEVNDNIDSYSLEEIEAKLSILCVRNKVSFDLDKDTDPVVFSLNNGDNSNDEMVPEWVKAIQNVAKEF